MPYSLTHPYSLHKALKQTNRKYFYNIIKAYKDRNPGSNYFLCKDEIGRTLISVMFNERFKDILEYSVVNDIDFFQSALRDDFSLGFKVWNFLKDGDISSKLLNTLLKFAATHEENKENSGDRECNLTKQTSLYFKFEKRRSRFGAIDMGIIEESPEEWVKSVAMQP